MYIYIYVHNSINFKITSIGRGTVLICMGLNYGYGATRKPGSITV